MPGRQGGFFRRLKDKQQKDAKKARRGTTGMKKADRIRKKNAMIDLMAAQRQLQDLDQISTSSDEGPRDDDDADSTDSIPQADASLAKLRGLLGVARGPSADGTDSETGDDSADNSASRDDESDAKDDDDNSGEATDDEDEEGGLEVCAICSADLAGGSEGFACPQCQACYCVDCHESTHAELGHAVVDLNELGGDDEEDDEEGLGDDLVDDDDDAEDLFAKVGGVAKRGGSSGEDDDDEEDDDEEDDEAHAEDEVPDAGREGAFEGDETGKAATAERDERRQAFLPAFNYEGASAAGLDTASVVAKALGARDPWFLTYIVDTRLTSSSTKSSKREKDTDDDDALVDVTEDAMFAPMASRGEAAAFPPSSGKRGKALSTPSAATQSIGVKLSRGAASFLKSWPWPAGGANALLSDGAACPALVVPFVWKKWVAYRQQCDLPPLTPEAWAKFNALSTYGDAQVTTRTWANEASWVDAVALHLLNHWGKATTAMTADDEVLRARAKAKRLRRAANGSNRKAKRGRADEEGEDGGDIGEDEDEVELRDRGFSKTRLLLVLPMRHLALTYMRIFHGVLGDRDDAAQAKFESFVADFSEIDELVDKKFTRRPLDYQYQFAGNINDTFCVGASWRPSGMSVYSHVLNSDILVCSPVGLRKRIGKDADALVSLSSIEVAVVDQAQALHMQNWEHFVELMRLVNKTPADTTEGLADLRRVFPWALQGRAAAHRQTVMLATHSHAAFNNFFRNQCERGIRGQVVVAASQYVGVLPEIVFNLRQHFARFSSSAVATLDQARFDFFTQHVFPSRVKALVDRNARTILFVPSTLDYLQLRVFLDDQLRGSFAELTEHSSERAQRKALGQFSALERPLLVVTERFNFFKRYAVKHAEALVFYSPPQFAESYSSFVNRLSADSPHATVFCPFTKYDFFELERVIGSIRAKQVLTRPTDSFIFVSSTSQSMV
jgi:U3 small nucleolar RNA-associated protein 25